MALYISDENGKLVKFAGTTFNKVIDNLESDSSTIALSARQGAILDDKITNEVETRASEDTKLQNSITNLNTYVNDTFLPLAGGEMTGPLKIDGGDSQTAGKIALGTNGQITNDGTATIFGFINSSTNLTVGNSSYNLLLRGNTTNPTYNGNNLALQSDLPTIDSALSDTSTNPVQNKVVKAALSNYLPLTGGTITGNLTISGNITQNGSQYITHAEKVYTKNDYITLREDATGGLANGDYSGLEFFKYDGTNNGRLVIDNQGIARVGDEGDEQPLATREETPLDGGYAKWDAAQNKFITTELEIPEIEIDSELSATSENPIENKVITKTINDVINNTTKITDSAGGFAAGRNAVVTNGAAAIGLEADARSGGGSIGQSSYSTNGGGAVGFLAKSNMGGGAIGQNAKTYSGGAIGLEAISDNGFAGGQGAISGTGFAGGQGAKTLSGNTRIDAIQLGTGTNSTEKTLQVYSDNIYNANTHRLTVQHAKANKFYIDAHWQVYTDTDGSLVFKYV